MDAYLQHVQHSAKQYEAFEGKADDDKEFNDPNERQMAQSRKAYYRELKRVLEESDVVIQVLDARDPEGCRSTEIEQEALK